MDTVNPLLYARMMPLTERPLRKDAERNRQRILDAARELFAERGLGATLNDVAHHAGVGVGTVYRRFPDKDQLIEELFEQRLDEIAELAREASEEPDPWTGVTRFLTRVLELQAADRGLKELILSTPGAVDHAARMRERMLPIVGGMVARAKSGGRLRADFAPEDMPLIQLMIGTVIDVARDLEPELWRRYLEFVIQGMRADPGPPPALPAPALEPERVALLMQSWQPPRR